MSQRRPTPSRSTTVRCAIYTRKSTEEGLDQAFNSLDAQREAGEAYIKSQAHEGWVLMPERYDDGGYTGGNMDRPALKRLLAAIEAGTVDCIVIYKIDRLSRSLLDFARMAGIFEQHNVTFVSVTQQLNSSTSTGRLMLNVLFSFAQFERELVSERTRDKIAMARRKGKWTGGQPLLGYDIDPRGRRLLVNEREAAQIGAIFQLYLEHLSLLPVVQELEKRGWVTKRWTTKKGVARGGKPIGKTRLHQLLTNVAYLGKVRHKDQVYAGEHPGIINEQVWQKVQTLLARNGRSGGALVRNRYGSILKGLIYCKPCGCSMSPSMTRRKGNRIYRYYCCTRAQQHGWAQCPSKSVPAGQIEEFVIDQIRAIGNDPMLVPEVLQAAQRRERERQQQLEREELGLERDLVRIQGEVRDLVKQLGAAEQAGASARLGDLEERQRQAEARAKDVRLELQHIARERVAAADMVAALKAFDPVWETLSFGERARILELLIERVEYDGSEQNVTITFRDNGLPSLVQ